MKDEFDPLAEYHKQTNGGSACNSMTVSINVVHNLDEFEARLDRIIYKAKQVNALTAGNGQEVFLDDQGKR